MPGVPSSSVPSAKVTAADATDIIRVINMSTIINGFFTKTSCYIDLPDFAQTTLRGATYRKPL
jgi:hypothetical protein